MNDKDRDLQLVRQAINLLIDHFDSVHIFCTRHDPAVADGTVSVNLGNGNWFSRYGQVREWLIKKDEEARLDARNHFDNTQDQQ